MQEKGKGKGKMSLLIANCSFEGHPISIALASGSFNLSSSILPAQVTSNQPANLRVVFDYLSDHFGETDTYYVWNALYRKYVYALGLDSIDLLASNGVAHGIIKDFDKAYPGTLIWESGNLTIEDLLGHPITQPGYYTITFDLAFNWFITWDRYYCVPIIPGCYWAYDWSGSCRPAAISECIIESLAYRVYVNVPPPLPPDLHFDLDLCSVQASTVIPTQKFNIQIEIANNNSSSGPLYIGCFCKGAYQQLWQGTISGNIPVPKTLIVTANQLAQMTLTESDYLSFTLSVSNTPGNPPPDATVSNPYGITGRWTPAAIYVNATTPPPSGSANLSGQVVDKTGAGIGNALVTAGSYSTSTDFSGNYTLQGLQPGTYTVTVTAAGYNDWSQSKTLAAGSNTLAVTMTATGEQPSMSWTKVLGGGAIIAGVGIVLSQIVKRKGGLHGKR